MSKKEEMYREVENWRESGLSLQEYSEQHGLKSHLLGYWVDKKKKEESGQPVGFTRLQPSVPISGYEITYPSGVKLHVKNADLATLSQLLRL